MCEMQREREREREIVKYLFSFVGHWEILVMVSVSVVTCQSLHCWSVSVGFGGKKLRSRFHMISVSVFFLMNGVGLSCLVWTIVAVTRVVS